MARIQLTRRQLYDQVWSQPMLQLAKAYGLSDVGMAKLCRRHNIPRPPRGYWAKKEHGYKPRQTPLPNPNDDGVIMLNDPKDCQLADPELDQAVQEPIADEIRQEARIEVAASLRGAHALVSTANEEFAAAKKDSVGLLIPPEGASLDIRVSKAQLRRALLVLNALLKALGKRGYVIDAGPVVTIFDQRIDFAITEQLETIRQEPEEHDLGGHYEFGHSRLLTERVPSGRLALHIPEAERYWANGCRKTWRDAKKQKIEDCLNKFVAGLVEVAARKREHEVAEEVRRKQEAEAARKRQEEALARAERRKLQQEEQVRLNGLLQQVANWRKSMDIREFIEVVRNEHMAAGAPVDAESEIGRWLSWAAEHADRLDPLVKSPPSILDEVIPDEPKRYSW